MLGRRCGRSVGSAHARSPPLCLLPLPHPTPPPTPLPLKQILKYHIVPASLPSAALSDADKLPTLLSAELAATAAAKPTLRKPHKGPKEESEDGVLTIDKVKAS